MPGVQSQLCTINDLEAFPIDPERGFLPSPDPLDRLPAHFAHWEEVAHNLPKLLVASQLRPALEQLPILDIRQLQDEAQIRRAMLLLSYFGHGYVWGEEKPANHIPAGVAVPWYEVAGRLGRPPVLSYASYALHNWRRLNPQGPIGLGNIVLLQNFLAGADEEWFILIHVDIEAKAAPALAVISQAQKAAAEDRLQELELHLVTLATALRRMYTTLLRMPEYCDPYIYYNRVRPYIHGWKDHPALPDGVIYEGVEAYNSKPRKFRGETGAQSSIMPSLDAALGIAHQDDPLRPYLMEMRAYMPSPHRGFIESVERGPSIRKYVRQHHHRHSSLVDAYNTCLHWIELFRSTHLEYAWRYIQQQSQPGLSNPTNRGTGGTPFMPYLQKHHNETAEHHIS